MASVNMMIGAAPEIGVSGMPANPAAPMATIVESTMTATVATVAATERMISNVKRRMTPNMSGTSVPRSAVPVSANALLSIETPVNENWISGYSITS